MKKDKYLLQQRIHEERGAYERARKRKFLYLKRTNQLDKYYQLKAGIKVEKKTIRDYELTRLRISIWQRFVNLIKRSFNYVSKILLRPVQSRDKN